MDILIPLLTAFVGGAVVAVANYLLQRHNAYLQIKNAIAERRVKAIGAAWSSVYKYECAVTNVLREAISRCSGEDDRDAIRFSVKRANDIAERRHIIVIDTVEENRFWLGQEMYQAIMEYHNSIVERLRAAAEKDLDQLRSIEQDLQEAKQFATTLLSRVR